MRSAGGPSRQIAATAWMVGIAAGFVTAFHLLGLLNILFGHPTITGAAVLLTSATGICLPIIALRRMRLSRPAQARAAGTALPRAVKAIVILAAVPYAALLLNSFIAYPSGTDALAYHINVALKWLQDGTMRVDPTLGWQYALPGNAELPALFALSLGMQKAVAVGNMLSVILLAVSLYLIAWKITRQSAASILSVAVALTIPIVVYQTFDLYVDLAGTAFLMASIALLLWRERSRVPFIFLSALAAGIAIGTKPVFWIYGAMYGPAALAAILWDRTRRIKCTALLAAGLALPSAFWFYRAADATGNPIYPIRPPFLHTQKAAGYATGTIARVGAFDYSPLELLRVSAYAWTELPHDEGLPVGPDRGTGPLFPAIAIPGLIFLMMRGFRSLRRHEFSADAVLALIALAGWAVWIVQLRVTRFGLPVIVLTCGLAAPMIAELLAQSRRVVLGLCIAGVLLDAGYCLVGPADALVRRIRVGDWSRAAYYGYPPVIDMLPAGSRVLDRNDIHAFILAGAGIANSVRALGDVKGADYFVQSGPAGTEEAALEGSGAKLIYSGVPRNLYPKVNPPWRVYRLPPVR